MNRVHHERVHDLQTLAEEVERKRQKWTRDRAALDIEKLTVLVLIHSPKSILTMFLRRGNWSQEACTQHASFTV